MQIEAKCVHICAKCEQKKCENCSKNSSQPWSVILCENILNIITLKSLELRTWNFDTMVAIPYVSCVMSYVSQKTKKKWWS